MKNTVKKIANHFIKLFSDRKYRVVERGNGAVKGFTVDTTHEVMFVIQEAQFTTKSTHEFDGKFSYRLVSGDFNYQPFWKDTGIEFTQEEKNDLDDNTKWVAIPESDYKWSDFLIIKQENDNDIGVYGEGYAGGMFTDRDGDYGSSIAFNFLTALQKVFPKKNVDWNYDYGFWSDDGIIIRKESN